MQTKWLRFSWVLCPMAKPLQRFLLERFNPLEAPDIAEGQGTAYRLADGIKEGADPMRVMLEAVAEWTRKGPGDLVGLLQELCGFDLRLGVWTAMTKKEEGGAVDVFARGGPKGPSSTSNTYAGGIMGLAGLGDMNFLTAVPDGQKESMAARVLSFPYGAYTAAYPIPACWLKGFSGRARLREIRRWLLLFEPEDPKKQESVLATSLTYDERVTLWGTVTLGPSTNAYLIDAFDTTVRLLYGYTYNEKDECYE